MNPAQAAGASTGANIAGSALSAFSSLYSGNAQSNLYNYQSGVAQVNAAIAKQDATYALGTGEVEAQQSGMRTRAQVGATKAGFGAGNIDVSSGSAKNVVASETEIGQANQATIRANAAKRAYGFNVTAAEDTAQAGVYSEAASTSRLSGELGAVSSIIGGVGQVSAKWMQASQSFGPTSGGDSDVTYSNYGYGST